MEKYQVIQKIENLGIVAVIRGNSVEEAIEFAKACEAGGINVLEVTFTVPNANEVITRLVNELGDKALIGAGTVLDAVSARLAIMSGSQFIVSSSFNPEVAKLCNLYAVPYIPGCLTPREMTEALEYGVDIIKVFPGSGFGPDYFKAIHGPMPHVRLMPTGGVSIDNVETWLEAGAVAIGVGSKLVSGSREEIIEKSKGFLEKIENFRKNKKQ